MNETTHVAIVGAGPAGLAVAACLRRAGVDFVVLEKAHTVAPAWRHHYERLHLHTIKQFSALPYVPFPKAYPRYVPRDRMVDYLESYAARFDVRPRFGETVRSAAWRDGAWHVDGTTLSLVASHLVVASGGNAAPSVPTFPGRDTFEGRILHSGDYRNAAPFADQSVLVVGMGNTGAEIALDLAEAGARPTLSVRNGVHIVPRDLFGVPIQMVAILATRLLPSRLNDRIFPYVLDLALGPLETFGIGRPKQGLLERVATASKIPVIDVGTVRGIITGAIKVAGGLRAITETGALFSDGTAGTFDAIVLATGYRPTYRNFLDGIAAERPRGIEEPNLHFVGFQTKITGLLREISREAKAVARVISRPRPTLTRP